MLEHIVKHKMKEIALLKKCREPFLDALKSAPGVAVIAEIKRKSPSKGLLCKDFDPVKIARQYESAGASALSVLTDEKFFGGSAAILRSVRKVTRLPILRKDFILSEAQIYESLVMGADAILLIAGILSPKKLKSLTNIASRAGLEVLYEVHSLEDLKAIRPLKPRIIGINNRDLSTFAVDLKTTERLSRHVPKNALLVSESGIRNAGDVRRVQKAGARAVLVGESLMKESSPGAALKRLLQGGGRGSR